MPISNVRQPNIPLITVSQYLDVLNEGLEAFTGKILGEICNLKLYPDRSYMYYSIKDKDDQSVINCFMWRRDYKLSGVDLVEGHEVILTGFPKIYKPNGGITMQVEYLESVGEGALKKAYDMLRAKLEKEGLFDIERKKEIPDYPHKIGIITSKDGAVINDFLSNIGKFGYDLNFINTRVEGKIALKELITAIHTFKRKNVDVLVVMRGGGSLESFQAFNNEALVKEIADFPTPIITGLGHDKDLPLAGMVSDLNVSTPTKVAEILNKSWEHADGLVDVYQKELLVRYERVLYQKQSLVSEYYGVISMSFNSIFAGFKEASMMLQNSAVKVLNYKLKMLNKEINDSWLVLEQKLSQSLALYKNKLEQFDKNIKFNDPLRQLKLGYSLILKNGKLIKSVSALTSGDIINLKLSDGNIESQVN